MWDYLAAHYYTGRAKGQVPFDPVSFFLCICLRREQNLGWRTLARLLAGEHSAGWRRLFGFQKGETPSEAGLGYFFHTVGREVFDELCPLFTDLLHEAGLLPEQSTFPGDPPGRGGDHQPRPHAPRGPLQHGLCPGDGRLLPAGAPPLSGPGSQQSRLWLRHRGLRADLPSGHPPGPGSPLHRLHRAQQAR